MAHELPSVADHIGLEDLIQVQGRLGQAISGKLLNLVSRPLITGFHGDGKLIPSPLDIQQAG